VWDNGRNRKELTMKRLLVGLDGSPRAQGVLTAAVALARRTGARLVLFRAVGLPHDHDLPADAYAMPPEEIVPMLEQRATEALQKLAAAVSPSLIAGVRAHVGSPWDAICR